MKTIPGGESLPITTCQSVEESFRLPPTFTSTSSSVTGNTDYWLQVRRFVNQLFTGQIGSTWESFRAHLFFFIRAGRGNTEIKEQMFEPGVFVTVMAGEEMIGAVLVCSKLLKMNKKMKE